MAFVPYAPIAGQGVHVVAAVQLLQRFRGVLHYQIDDFFKLGQVPVTPFGVLFRSRLKAFAKSAVNRPISASPLRAGRVRW